MLAIEWNLPVLWYLEQAVSELSLPLRRSGKFKESDKRLCAESPKAVYIPLQFPSEGTARSTWCHVDAFRLGFLLWMETVAQIWKTRQ